MGTNRILAMPLIAATLLAAAAPASAESEPAPERTAVVQAINTFQNQQTGDCLDDSFAYGVRTYPCNGLDFQKWSVRVWSDGTREFRNVNTGRCLGADASGDVFGGECSTSTQASWYVKRWNDGTLELKNQASSQCLEDKFVALVTAGCNASRDQSWY